ncbi:MAG: nicotinate-nucleotide diphosphorylase (carboxylating) [Chitinophagaceae bacterium]|nr:MAG: nicotinate-nucleotide diphosphorylase (carboxylating) [Chitinophagaceae bacterium]
MDKYFQKSVFKLINRALKEDIGSGDITSLATIHPSQQSVGTVLVKEACIIAGVELAQLISQLLDPSIVCTFSVKDGDHVSANKSIGKLTGSTVSILKAERLILNCMQRMSGIATKTNILVKIIAPFGAQLLDTRKTTPNNRLLEKWAVRIGGGVNHRMGLYDTILIKDNHIAAAGGIKEALKRCKAYIKKEKLSVPVIVEVKNEKEFAEVVKHPMVDRVLLDNFTPIKLNRIVVVNKKKKVLEASGGINKTNIKLFAQTGVDFISVGDITHHIESIDISLKIH